MPLGDVDVQKVPRGEGPPAEGADAPVQRVVVVLIALQRVEHLRAAGDVTAKLRHPVKEGQHVTASSACKRLYVQVSLVGSAPKAVGTAPELPGRSSLTKV